MKGIVFIEESNRIAVSSNDDKRMKPIDLIEMEQENAMEQENI